MISKLAIKKLFLSYSGYSQLKWFFRPQGLYCFNYHRIGHADQTLLDPNVFSCTTELLDQHLKFYRENFQVINIAQLIELVKNNKPLNKHYALITFDDGYIDNYEQAFPCLKKHQLPAAFFVPTAYVETNKIPWWDQIGWMVRHSEIKQITLSNDHSSQNITIDRQAINKTLRSITSYIKHNRDIPLDIFMQSIASQTEHQFDNIDIQQPLFMTWEMLREMSASGMDIGSHSHSHKILSSLSEADQLSEIQLSKTTIEEKLNKTVNAFAYPEGGIETYTQQTVTILGNLGYQVGFNFCRDINVDLQSNLYELNRFSVSENCTVDDLKSFT
jgi:peptidoglycan/xylan/chitin deacetylase (PgdA/CDA1 family)